MSIIVVGKNSFIGRALCLHEKTRDWTFLSHDEPVTIERGDILINCALHPDLISQPYDASKDLDLRLASGFGDRLSLYVMLSSRAVYPNALLMDEDTPLAPQGFYGEAKAETESRLKALLPDNKLLILRCANLFGDEYGRKSFTGLCATRLKDEGRIVFGLSPQTRKDFLPVDAFCERLAAAVTRKLTGVYNMGSGIALPCGQVADAMIKGFGEGRLEVESDQVSGQFSLDMYRLTTDLDLDTLTDRDILGSFETVGHNLHAYVLN